MKLLFQDDSKMPRRRTPEPTPDLDNEYDIPPFLRNKDHF